MSEKYSEEVEIELPDEMIKQIEELAKEQGISFDDVVNNLLKEHIEEQEYLESYKEYDV